MKVLKDLFVSMPSRKRKDGTFRDVVHPLNPETRSMIEDRVVQEYKTVMDMGGAHHSSMDEE